MISEDDPQREAKLDGIYKKAHDQLVNAIRTVIETMKEEGAPDIDIKDMLHDLLPEAKEEAWRKVRRSSG